MQPDAIYWTRPNNGTATTGRFLDAIVKTMAHVSEEQTCGPEESCSDPRLACAACTRSMLPTREFTVTLPTEMSTGQYRAARPRTCAAKSLNGGSVVVRRSPACLLGVAGLGASSSPCACHSVPTQYGHIQSDLILRDSAMPMVGLTRSYLSV